MSSPPRTTGEDNSDIARELAHLMLEHNLPEVRDLNGMPFRGRTGLLASAW